MEILQNNLRDGFELYKKEYENTALRVLRSGWYVLGKELQNFERAFAKYNHSKYAAGVASGLDSLWIAMRMLGIGNGDEVIVPANTYIATIMGITINNAVPKFVEPDEFYGIDAKKIEMEITDKTRAILVVHLFGCPCQMDEIVKIANKHNLLLIEDCAQSHGAKYGDKFTGTFGSAGCFSFYPTKNLGGFGDGGCILTNDKSIYDKVITFRNYGSRIKYENELVGANSRLDEIQAALLEVKLSHLDEINNERIMIADNYDKGIINDKIHKPRIRPNSKCVYHQYVVRLDDLKERNSFIEYLRNNNIKTCVHYPIPPHLSVAYKYLGYKRGDFPISEKLSETMVSLPMYNGMSKDKQDYVIKIINDF